MAKEHDILGMECINLPLLRHLKNNFIATIINVFAISDCSKGSEADDFWFNTTQLFLISTKIEAYYKISLFEVIYKFIKLYKRELHYQLEVLLNVICRRSSSTSIKGQC